ncbi:unnamed protein product, partial [Oppiella nova]
YELIGGIDGLFFTTIAEYYNITYDVINTNGVFGVQPVNNTWSGVIGMLQSKIVILAVPTIISLHVIYGWNQLNV